MSNLEWIIKWYCKYLDGDWEDGYGVKIRTLGNPGWDVEIDLMETSLENITIQSGLVEASEVRWYFWKIKDAKFTASGDETKLDFLLGEFRRLCLEYGENLERPRPTYED